MTAWKMEYQEWRTSRLELRKKSNSTVATRPHSTGRKAKSTEGEGGTKEGLLRLYGVLRTDDRLTPCPYPVPRG